MRRAVFRTVLPRLQRQPSLFRNLASPPHENKSAARTAGILVSNLYSPDNLRELVQQQDDKLSPGLTDYEVQHQTRSGTFRPGWPTDPHGFIRRGGEILVRSQSFDMNFAERLASVERKDQEKGFQISLLTNDNQTLKRININQMKVLRRIFLDSFRKHFRVNGPAPRPLKSWNDWVYGLDSAVSVKGVTRDDLQLTLFGKKVGEDVAQNVGDRAAHEADASQIAIALDFFMTEKGESKRWDNLFKALYGMSVQDAMANVQ